MANDNRALPGLESIKDWTLKNMLQNLHNRVLVLQDQQTQRQGTLNPDQKPTLSQREAGSVFYATDFNRSYVWSGSVWGDVPGAPPRGQTAPFHIDPVPLEGWVKCDGNRATRSTSTGGVEQFVTPAVAPANGLVTWMRV